MVGIAICVIAPHAWSQETPPPEARDQPPAPTTVQAYPLELLGLLAPPAQLRPVTLTPSIAFSEEYNDNLFLDNRTRQWDLITGFSPAVTLFVNEPSYRFSGGYTLTGELYDRQTRLNNAVGRQNFLFNGSLDATPRLRLTVFESFALDRNANRVSAQNFSSGVSTQQGSWSNTFTPGMTWQMTPRTALSLSASYNLLRFEGASSGSDITNSDTYGMQSYLSHVLTPRLTGTVGYYFTYLEFHVTGGAASATQTQAPGASRTHIPTVGLSYRLTPTLTVSANGGPAITEVGGQTFLSPAGNASLVQVLKIGSASVQYNRSVSVAGGFGGSTDNQIYSGALTLPTWQRGLVLAFSPAYSVAESVSRQQTQTGRVNVKALLLTLGVTYQLARFASVFGGYTFFQQRSGGTSSSDLVDADQSRVRFGLQFGYPINFD